MVYSWNEDYTITFEFTAVSPLIMYVYIASSNIFLCRIQIVDISNGVLLKFLWELMYIMMYLMILISRIPTKLVSLFQVIILNSALCTCRSYYWLQGFWSFW